MSICEYLRHFFNIFFEKKKILNKKRPLSKEIRAFIGNFIAGGLKLQGRGMVMRHFTSQKKIG
jgi:hypothetical protein